MVKFNSAKEKIILAPGANANELLKTLAKFGVNTFNLRIFDSSDLALYALQKNGIVIEEKFVAESNQAFLVFTEMKKDEYFSTYRYKDAHNFMSSINDLRKYILEDDEETEINNKLTSDTFPKKNPAVRKVIKLYFNELKNNTLIDEIQIMRMAIKNCKPLKNVEVITLKEFPLKPLHKKLLEIICPNDVTELSLADENKPLVISSYTKAWGSRNEFEHILNYIATHPDIKFDQCLIVTLDNPNYSKLVDEYKILNQFNAVNGFNYSVSETQPGHLFSLVDEWMRYEFHKKYLKELVFDRVFNLDKFLHDINYDTYLDEYNSNAKKGNKITVDSIIEMAGDLSLSFDVASNNDKVENLFALINSYNGSDLEAHEAEEIKFEFVRRIRDILNKGLLNLLNEYAIISPVAKVAEENALTDICNLLALAEKYNVLYEDIEPEILNIAVGSSPSKENNLYICGLNKALSVIRPYVFITGLSSNNFPGANKEDPIILDEDYTCFGVDKTVDNKVNTNIKLLDDLINLANTYCKEIHLSYSSYDSCSLKELPASSALLKYYKKQYGDDKTLTNFEDEFKNKTPGFVVTTYFENSMSNLDKVGEAYLNNKTIVFNDDKTKDAESESEEKEENKTPVDENVKKKFLNKYYSASAIMKYQECEQEFYLQYLLGFENEQEENIYEIISPNQVGDLAHALMAHLDKNVVTKEEFLDEASRAIDDFFIRHPNDNLPAVQKEKDEFINIMSNAYDLEDHQQTYLSEEDLYCTHESGIKIHGFPDKVKKTTIGYTVIDYKTNRVQKHFEDQLETLIQLTMYSYILSHQGKDSINVTSFVYRYLRLNKDVPSTNMEDHYLVLKNLLDRLYVSITTNSFAKKAKPNQCPSYCTFKDYCFKKNDVEED